MEQVYKQRKNRKNVVVLEYVRQVITGNDRYVITGIYCYLERKNYKDVKFI